MSKHHRWVLGNGAYVLNEEATMEVLLSGIVAWLQHAQDMNEVLSKRLSFENQDHQQTINTLGSIALLTSMGLDCAKQVRVQATYLENPTASYP